MIGQRLGPHPPSTSLAHLFGVIALLVQTKAPVLRLRQLYTSYAPAMHPRRLCTAIGCRPCAGSTNARRRWTAQHWHRPSCSTLVTTSFLPQRIFITSSLFLLTSALACHSSRLSDLFLIAAQTNYCTPDVYPKAGEASSQPSR